MALTPDSLQKRFGLAPNLGERAVARVYHAFCGERKSDRRMLLSVVYPSIMAGPLPAEGAPDKWQRQVPQYELAASSGCRRQSFTRRLSRFTPLSELFNSVQSRQEHAQRLYEKARLKHQLHMSDCEACRNGQQCETGAALKQRIRAPKQRRELPRPLPVLNRNRCFAKPNRMTFRMPKREEMFAVIETGSGRQLSQHYSQASAAAECERLQKETRRQYQVELVPVDKREFRAPGLEQLTAEDNPGRQWWDESFDGAGFKNISRWIWDERLLDLDDGRSLGVTERLVMSAYEHFGLLEEFRQNGEVTKPRGILVIYQKKVAAYLGISVRKLYDAHQKWAQLGVLRIAHDRRELETENGQPEKWSSGPQIVLYVPFLQLTDAEAARETARMAARLAEIVAREGRVRERQLERTRTIHQELLRAWAGTERKLYTFWRELRKKLEAAAVDRWIIDYVVPIPAERPPE